MCINARTQVESPLYRNSAHNAPSTRRTTDEGLDEIAAHFANFRRIIYCCVDITLVLIMSTMRITIRIKH